MRLILGCVLIAASVLPGPGQEIVKAGEFTSYENNVQFLPGAIVVLDNDIRDSKTKIYKYQAGGFVRVRTGLPLAIKRWRSFNWESVDHYNQLDLSFVENPSISGFLPPHSKVKGYATISGFASDKTIVALCYAAVPDEVLAQDRVSAGGPRNLHLLMLSRKSPQEFTHTIYTKIADVLVAQEVSFGTMLVEREASGTFVAIYFADGGSHQTNSIAVFKLRSSRRPAK